VLAGSIRVALSSRARRRRPRAHDLEQSQPLREGYV